MPDFHNPYHFVPVSKRKPTAADLSVVAFEKGDNGAVRHDRYVAGTRSGRIVCRIETESPMVLGAKRNPEQQPAEAEPFELEGKPAIPASSLRGLFGSIAEAASNSALRVLEKRHFTYRRPPGEALSAIGVVVDGNDGFSLYPLTLPTYDVNRGAARPADGLPWERIFTSQATLKVYIGRDRDAIRDAAAFPYKTPIWAGGTFTELHYMKLHTPVRRLGRNGELAVDPGCVQAGRWVVAQKAAVLGTLPITEAELNLLPAQEQALYTSGIVRMLGVAGRNDIPRGKKHEIFIPFGAGTFGTALAIPSEVVDRFHRMCDERTKDSTQGGKKVLASHKRLPYHLDGTARNNGAADLLREGDQLKWDEHGQRYRLKVGDLVYFRPNQTCTEAAEVSLSAIWRGEVAGDSYEFFAKVDQELLPFRRGRKIITPAEAVFGFVEDRKDGEAEKQALALAGRVRFSHALFSGGDPTRGPAVVLKILGEPKPPSPALYFKNDSGNNYISKSKLELASHRPQGRKMYLHHSDEHVQGEYWKTAPPPRDLEMKTKVQPMKKGVVYHFHVDFDNLTDAELGMLLYALRPTDTFRHKIGMGKSLGLGRIRVDVAGLFLIDRFKRYSSGEVLSGRRYHEAFVADANLFATAKYTRELADAKDATAVDVAAIRNAFVPEATARHALELIGDPASVNHPVHTPLTEFQMNPESKTYEWFVQNDRGGGQQLKSIERTDSTIPTLKR